MAANNPVGSTSGSGSSHTQSTTPEIGSGVAPRNLREQYSVTLAGLQRGCVDIPALIVLLQQLGDLAGYTDLPAAPATTATEECRGITPHTGEAPSPSDDPPTRESCSVASKLMGRRTRRSKTKPADHSLRFDDLGERFKIVVCQVGRALQVSERQLEGASLQRIHAWLSEHRDLIPGTVLVQFEHFRRYFNHAKQYLPVNENWKHHARERFCARPLGGKTAPSNRPPANVRGAIPHSRPNPAAGCASGCASGFYRGPGGRQGRVGG